MVLAAAAIGGVIAVRSMREPSESKPAPARVTAVAAPVPRPALPAVSRGDAGEAAAPRVSGRVVVDGAACAQVLVEAHWLDAAGQPQTVSNGAFEEDCTFDLEVGPGEISITASQADLIPLTVDGIKLRAGEEIRGLVLQLSAGMSIDGQVSDPAGNPVDARVRLRGLGRSEVINPNGFNHFTFEGLAEGRYEVSAWDHELGSDTVTAKAGDTGVLLTLGRHHRLVGYVTDDEGRAIGDVAVSIIEYTQWGGGPNEEDNFEPSLTVTTDARGAFSADVSADVPVTLYVDDGERAGLLDLGPKFDAEAHLVARTKSKAVIRVRPLNRPRPTKLPPGQSEFVEFWAINPRYRFANATGALLPGGKVEVKAWRDVPYQLALSRALRFVHVVELDGASFVARIYNPDVCCIEGAVEEELDPNDGGVGEDSVPPVRLHEAPPSPVGH